MSLPVCPQSATLVPSTKQLPADAVANRAHDILDLVEHVNDALAVTFHVNTGATGLTGVVAMARRTLDEVEDLARDIYDDAEERRKLAAEAALVERLHKEEAARVAGGAR